MAQNNSMFEGVLAGLLGGAAAGTIATPGIGSVIGAVAGAIVGAALRVKLIQVILIVLGLYGLSYITSFPPYLWIILIAVTGIWIIRGSKQ